jgi:selenocysteine lyase/cysteine desulfurase
VSPDRYELRCDARRFETWENNYAARLGMGIAIDYALALGLEAIKCRTLLLATRLRSGLSTIPGVELRDLGCNQCAIVSFTVAGCPAPAVVAAAARAGVTIGLSEPNGALLDATARRLPVIVRVSPHYYNTEAEVDRLLDVVSGLRLPGAIKASA